MKLPNIMKSDFAQYAIGAVTYAVARTGARYALNPTPAYQIFDNNGNYVWGMGVDNLITAAIGGGIYAVGKFKKMPIAKNVGKGYLLQFVVEKFVSEPLNYVNTLYPPPPFQAMGKTAYSASSYTPQAMPAVARYSIAPAKKGAYR
jgi:hypothetical protein